MIDNGADRKRVKNDNKFHIQLNEEQKLGKAIILESKITIITGWAGSGKTLLVAQTILDLLAKGEVNKVYITRPTQQLGSSLGYLPGALSEKLDPYLDPFKDNLYQCLDKLKVDALFREEKIEGTALQFLRGKNFGKGRVLVVDESQNTKVDEMLAILTRLGKGGKIIIIGDVFQKDTSESFDGLSYAINMAKRIPEIALIKLHENHRDDLVSKILDYEYGNKNL